MSIEQNMERIVREFERKRPTVFKKVDPDNPNNATLEMIFFHKRDSNLPVATSFIFMSDEILAQVSPASGTEVIVYHGKDATAACAEAIAYLHQFFKQTEKAQKLLGYK